jgi:hypothetical protein
VIAKRSSKSRATYAPDIRRKQRSINAGTSEVTMSLYLHNLDARTRSLMHAEVQLDITHSQLYLSPRLSNLGLVAYPAVLLAAVAQGDADSLATSIANARMLNECETSHSRRGTAYVKRVQHDAHITLAHGEYNRFYLRGLCVRALEDGISHLEIYRAKVVNSPRWDSEARIAKLIAAAALLADLRANIGVDVALGVPNGPNSGLSARLPAASSTATTGIGA